MKAFLMYRDHDFDINCMLPDHSSALIKDLELVTLFNAMAAGDEYIFQVAKQAVLCGLSDLDTIIYRQDIMKDCLENYHIVKDMYNLLIEAIEKRKKVYFGLWGKPSLYNLLEVLQIFAGILKRLQSIAEEHSSKFSSEVFVTLFNMLKRELSDEYLARIQNHLRELKFRDGVLISAEWGAEIRA